MEPTNREDSAGNTSLPTKRADGSHAFGPARGGARARSRALV
jgi:hypothetical protein